MTVMRNGTNRRSLVKEQSYNDIIFTVFLTLVWTNSILMRYLRVLIQMLPFLWKHADLLLSAAVLFTLLLSLGVILRYVYMKELFLVLAMYGLFYLHYYLFPLNEAYYTVWGKTTTGKCFPMFLIGLCAYRINREESIKVLYKLSVITVYAFIIYASLISKIDASTLRDGDMHGAYSILPHLCLVFTGVLRKPNGWNIGAFALGAVFLLFLGNRGSLLCLSVCVIFVVLFSGRLKKPWLFLSISLLLMALLFLFGLLDFLQSLAEKYEFSLRIFEKMESGQLTADSGRDKIQDRVWYYIKMYPMMGMGLFSDRRVAGGKYAHNIILEILAHHGFTIGILLLILFAYYFVGAYSYLRRDNQLAKDLYGALLFSSVFKLFMSSSYLLEPYFFFTLGFAYAAMSEYRKKKLQKRRIKDRTELVRLRRIRA